MSRGTIGCMVIGAAVFVGIGVLALSMVAAPAGCPARLQWAEQAYAATGAAAASPNLGDARGDPVEIGSTFIGLGTRRVLAPAGTSPSPSAGSRPDVVALECGDGTWQAYRADR